MFPYRVDLEFYVSCYSSQMFLKGVKESFPVSLLNREGDVVRFQELFEIFRGGFLDLLKSCDVRVFVLITLV